MSGKGLTEVLESAEMRPELPDSEYGAFIEMCFAAMAPYVVEPEEDADGA